MKKTIITGLLILFMWAPVMQVRAADTQRGGPMGFIAGCCFGIRTAGAYNEGKSIHWRQWCRLIPYVNLIFTVWDGVDGVNGVTTADYAQKYGAMYY